MNKVAIPEAAIEATYEAALSSTEVRRAAEEAEDRAYTSARTTADYAGRTF